MLLHSAERKRCATCERWSGPRQPAEQAGHVLIESETVVGLCQGGPWHESERRARSACGHWRCWPLIAAPTAPDSA